MDTHNPRNISTELRENAHFYAGRQVQSAPFIGGIWREKDKMSSGIVICKI